MKVSYLSSGYLGRLKKRFLRLMVCGFLVAASWLLIVAPRQASAQTLVFTEDFSGDLSKWQPVRDDGSMWQIVDGQVEVTVPRRSTLTELVPKDEYWSSDWKNIAFRYEITPLEGVDRNTSFGWESIQRWFEVHFVNGLLNVVRIEDGNRPFDLFESYNMVNGQTYEVIIVIRDKTITVSVNGEGQAEGTYEEYVNQGGKIGLKAGAGTVAPTRVRFDNIRVINLDGAADTNLDITLLKQTDPLWKNQIYDHATAWSSQPTIERWGCLLTSIVMVMRYHGLTTFTNGETITPSSLNQWLQSQPDGYIGEGLIVWSAITRLTKQLSTHFGTPSLEYTRVAGDSIEPSISFIENENPSILEIPGHFLVGNGFTQDRQDLLINDPAFSYSKLSQHQTPLRSTRLLTPSFTDLSYLYLAHEPSLNVTITNPDGSTPDGLETFIEELHPDPAIEGETGTQMVIHHLAKPTSGQFIISVSQENPAPYHLTVFAYDTAANLSSLSIDGWASTTPTTHTINYLKESNSTLATTLTFSHFRQILAELKTNDTILNTSIYDQLDAIATQAEAAQPTQQLEHTLQLYKLTTFYNSVLPTNTANYLRYLIHTLEESIVIPPGDDGTIQPCIAGNNSSNP